VSVHTSSAPPGYESFLVGRARVVAQQSLSGAVREAMTSQTLHEWAARQPRARGMQGRAMAWATTLPNGVEVVVRHSEHGGLFARVTQDLFRAPTRAPLELAAALRLADAGVPTPEVLAYAVYPAFGPFVRADVATRLLHGVPLPEAWEAATSEDARSALVDAVAVLLAALRRAGAHHPDLNVRNVFVLDSPAVPTAAVLDVDRVTFGAAGDPALAVLNVRRLLRSMAKERVGYGADITSRLAQRLNATAGPAS
jgi:hypothetical protein